MGRPADRPIETYPILEEAYSRIYRINQNTLYELNGIEIQSTMSAVRITVMDLGSLRSNYRSSYY
jgi:hypothetical protein